MKTSGIEMIPRTLYRKLRKDGGSVTQNWTAPEHSRVHRCIRLRDGTLALPEPDVLRAQRETERILNPR